MGVDVKKANEDHLSTSYRLYRFENYIRSNVQLLDGHVAYIIVNREDYERFQLTFNEAKEKVFVLGLSLIHILQSAYSFLQSQNRYRYDPACGKRIYVWYQMACNDTMWIPETSETDIE